MKENIKEDMKLLEEMRENCRTKRDYIDVKAERKATAIDNILSDYKRVLKENEELLEIRISAGAHNRIIELEKENEELKSSNKNLERANKCYINSIHSIVPVLNQDYIEKQKIKDKIEELNKKEKQELKGTKGQDRYSIKQQYMYQRNVLQDLLEEKGE